MALEQQIILDSDKTADADLSAHQFNFVKETSTGVALCAAATDIPCGILQNQPTSGQPAQVMRLGISKLVAGGAIAIGAQLGTDGTGKGDAKVAGTDTTEYVCGANIDHVAGASGRIITVTVNCLNPHRAA